MQKLLFILGVLSVSQMNAQLTIQNGLTITTNGCLITLQGNLINNGTIVGDIGSGWDFAGSTLQTIGGTSTTQFHNLRILNIAGINLGQHAQVNGSIFFQNGKLWLNQYNCTLTPNTTLSGPTANSYVVTNGTGVFKQTVPAFNLGIFPVGTAASYSPFVVENYGTVDEYSCRVTDSVYFNYSNGQQLGNPYLTQAVNKTWLVSEAVIGGGGIRTTAYWNASDELPAFDRNLVELRHFEDNTLAWNSISGGVPSSNNILYNIGRTYNSGVANLINRPFAVFSSGAPLPVKWLDFNVRRNSDDVLLNWQLEQQINNNHFVIQRSENGIHFSDIVTVLATAELNYQFNDVQVIPKYNAINKPVIFYRIKQVDRDGQFGFSAIRTVQLQKTSSFAFVQVFPNPSKDFFSLQWFSYDNSLPTDILLIDVSGKIIRQWKHTTIVGLNHFKTNIETIAAGHYQLLIKNSFHHHVKSIIVQ